ncbi:hypothetical protein BXZ70DRAFT_908950 [Cristinia sonorae]|uniref:Uncharacterized protein n=1 Tax=Cristinia sonorae TaxID=1940300 RepID=A0A8K0UKH2_9AGAR|nr:hypothetical protein BXZ70DRAFT_908950 [Cristinia sonorae]
MSARSRKPSRFGTTLDDEQHTKNAVHVPLYSDPNLSLDTVNSSDYTFYLVPVSPSTLESLNASATSEQLDSSDAYSDGPSLDSSGSFKFSSSSKHDLLLQNLVEAAAKFVPSRFSDGPSVEKKVAEDVPDVVVTSEQDGMAGPTINSNLHNTAPPRERTRTPSRLKPRSIAQTTLRAVLNQPPPSSGNSGDTDDVFSVVRSRKLSSGIGTSMLVRDREDQSPKPPSASGLQITPTQLRDIALLHYTLDTKNDTTPCKSCPPVPLDSWDDICKELKTLEVMRRDMVTMLSQSTSARSARGSPVRVRACV